MIYKIIHRTTYKYAYPVSVGNHVACLKPRTFAHNRLLRDELRIEPRPGILTERADYFGNLHYFFTIEEPHRELVVEARSHILRSEATPSPKPQPGSCRQARSPKTTLPKDSTRTSFSSSRRASPSGRSLAPMR